MSRRKREMLQVYYEVLKELHGNPLRISHLMRKCNMDTRMTNHVINLLLSRGLIIVKKEEKCKWYYITEKGVRFLELYEDLRKLLEKRS
ncbi:MAG: winged helix-turn-helix domain-containing protein [Desulfurococcaceae archaeon]